MDIVKSTSSSNENNSSLTQVKSIVVAPAKDVDIQDEPSDIQLMDEPDEPVYPTGAKRLTILLSLAIATFLVALVGFLIEIHYRN
jgi:hypothetical protein